jgi:methylmalonyl-CoA mutase
VAAFSAGLGGADGVTVLPFTAALGLPDAFARRVARNTQLILLEEANLWRVADPAAGAGGFEALTGSLVERAWAAFQEIEREGGLAASLAAGAVQGRVAAVAEARARAAATRRDPITGTSEFPDMHEAQVAVTDVTPTPPEAPAFAPAFPALPSLRAAEPFERLRDASDAAKARTGERPRVFLANLGPVAAFTARSTFAKNFFEAGGVEALTNDGFHDVPALVEAWRGSGARLVCLCSSDEIYKERAVEAAKALQAAGAATLYLAGRPGDLQEPLAQAGVTRHIFAGCDALAVLQEASSLA